MPFEHHVVVHDLAHCRRSLYVVAAYDRRHQRKTIEQVVFCPVPASQKISIFQVDGVPATRRTLIDPVDASQDFQSDCERELST